MIKDTLQSPMCSINRHSESFRIRASHCSISTKGNHGEECSRTALSAAERKTAQRAHIFHRTSQSFSLTVSISGCVHLSGKTDTLSVAQRSTFSSQIQHKQLVIIGLIYMFPFKEKIFWARPGRSDCIWILV